MERPDAPTPLNFAKSFGSHTLALASGGIAVIIQGFSSHYDWPARPAFNLLIAFCVFVGVYLHWKQERGARLKELDEFESYMDAPVLLLEIEPVDSANFEMYLHNEGATATHINFMPLALNAGKATAALFGGVIRPKEKKELIWLVTSPEGGDLINSGFQDVVDMMADQRILEPLSLMATYSRVDERVYILEYRLSVNHISRFPSLEYVGQKAFPR